MAPALVTPADILTFDLDGQALDAGDRRVYLERFIHAEIYRARPDVVAVVHSHSPSVIPFAVTKTPLRPVYHMSGFLGEGSAHFEIRDVAGNSDLLIRNATLGRALADALGSSTAVLMRGHGSTVVGTSLATGRLPRDLRRDERAAADAGARTWRRHVSERGGGVARRRDERYAARTRVGALATRSRAVSRDRAVILDKFKAVTLNACTGCAMPFSVTSPSGSASTASSIQLRVFWLVRICPPFASLHRRDGKVGDAADACVVPAPFEADGAKGRVALCDADAQIQFEAALRPRSSAAARNAVCIASAMLDRVRDGFVELDRVVEEDHHAVAGEVLERAFVTRISCPIAR